MMPDSERSLPERNKTTGGDGKPKEILGLGGGDGGVTDVPSGTGRGYLGSGSKPAGLSRQKGVAVLLSQTCLQ